MINFLPYDVLVLPFPFTSLTATKARPVVVVSSPAFHAARQDLIVLAVTSQVQNALDFEPMIHDQAAAGLLKPSCLKASLATIRSQDVLAKLGSLALSDRVQLDRLLRHIVLSSEA